MAGSAAAVAPRDLAADQRAGGAADDRADGAVTAAGDLAAEQAAGDRADDSPGRIVAAAAAIAIIIAVAPGVVALVV